MNDHEFAEEVVNFLDKIGQWKEFIQFMEEKGYKVSEFPKPFNDEE